MYRGAPDGRAPTPLPLLPLVLVLLTTAPAALLLLLHAQPVQPQVVGEVERLLTGAAAPGLQPLLSPVRRAASAMSSVGARSWGGEPGGGGRAGRPGRSGGPGGVGLAAGRVIVDGPEAAQLRGEEGRGPGMVSWDRKALAREEECREGSVMMLRLSVSSSSPRRALLCQLESSGKQLGQEWQGHRGCH